MSTIMDLGKLRFHWTGEWSNSTTYEVNDVAKLGGVVYLYIYSLATSGNPVTNTTYWVKLVEGFSFDGVYDNATQYEVGDTVTHGGKVYVANAATIGNTPPHANWSIFADGIQWENVYNNATGYQRNDVVKYGSSLYIATQDTSGNLPSDTAFWQKFVDGISAESVYNAATAYVVNDLVAYGGNIYRALGNTTGNLPTDTANWEVFVSSIRPRGVWSTAVAYEPNDVVSYGGNNYRVLIAHASGTFATDLAANRWEKFNGGVEWKGTYATATAYKVGDIFRYDVSSYIVIADFTSTNFAGDSANYEQLAVGSNLANVVGQANKVLSTDGTVTQWIVPQAGFEWSVKTANYTAVNGDRLVLDQSGGTFTVTLPASPSVGDEVYVMDGTGTMATVSVDIDNNGSVLMGASQALTFNVSNVGFNLVYTGATNGWRIA